MIAPIPAAPWGLRIRHPDPRFRGALLRIPHPTRRTAAGPKTYELRLDGEGSTTVSETVWRRICECWIPDAAGVAVPANTVFEVTNVVRNPPTLIYGGATQTQQFTLDPTNETPAGTVTVTGLTHKDR